jgi:hypothetical protein
MKNPPSNFPSYNKPTEDDDPFMSDKLREQRKLLAGARKEVKIPK